MKVPLEIHYRDVEVTPVVTRKINARAARLEKFCPGLISVRVAVERPQKHQRRGSRYRVRIEVGVPPGKRLVVRREPSQGDMHDPLQKVVGDAFESMERRLRETNDVRRGHVKHHDSPRDMTVATNART
ncbi:MAG: HPF/RaiA family ribosome-associated protein [Candidatus Binatia bacterium]